MTTKNKGTAHFMESALGGKIYSCGAPAHLSDDKAVAKMGHPGVVAVK
jgi:hypothetical protein